MGKRLLIFGPPAAGKGTHARRLAGDLKVPHIATGEMLRQAVQQGTGLGQEAATYLSRGELVLDGVVVGRLRRAVAT
jgi:adenylate kinase